MKITNEMKIGILVTAVVAALLILTFQVGDFNFSKKGYEIKVYFQRIEGIELNAPVRLNGLEVGSVRNIKIVYADDTKMELTLWLEDNAKLREGTQAYVKNMGLLGEKYIEISAGDPGKPFLTAGAVIVGQEPVDFEKLIAKGDLIADNLKELTDNLNERLRINSQAIDEIMVNLNVSLKHIASISSNIDDRLKVNQNAIDDIVANLNATSRNLEELSSDIKLNPWKLLYKEKTKR